jgi:predicted permease
MFDSALVVLPVFGLVGLGFVLRRIGLVGERAGDGLSDFVFNVAIPALIFRTLSQASLPAEPPWGYWLAYFGGVAVVWAIAMLMARRVFVRSRVEAVVAGFTAGQANTVLVGIPLILKVYGDAGAAPLFLLVAIHLPITMTVATLLVEGRNSDLGAILRRLATNPILIGILAGALARLVGF